MMKLEKEGQQGTKEPLAGTEKGDLAKTEGQRTESVRGRFRNVRVVSGTICQSK